MSKRLSFEYNKDHGTLEIYIDEEHVGYVTGCMLHGNATWGGDAMKVTQLEMNSGDLQFTQAAHADTFYKIWTGRE